MTRDWWQTDPTYVIDDPPKGFECPPILNFVGQMTRDNGLIIIVLQFEVCERKREDYQLSSGEGLHRKIVEPR